MLTKSDFILYLDNPLHFWARKHGHYTVSPDPGMRFNMRQGYEVEQLAIDYLRTTITDPNLALHEQKTLKTDQLKARVDLLVEELFTKNFQIYEIKSATRLKEKHIWDTAFQYYVASTDSTVTRAHLVHINNAYRLVDKLNFSEFFTIEDITDEVVEKQPLLPDLIQKALAISASDTPPPGLEGCSRLKDCPCPEICFKQTPTPTSIHFLGGKLPDTFDPNITDIRDIKNPEDFNRKQKRQIESAQSGEPVYDRDAIKSFLTRLNFPLYFLDYETINYAVPRYRGHAPQQHLPFQYSLHRLDAPDATLVHTQFLSRDQQDPGPPLLDQLKTEIGDTGSILVWYKHFEQARNRYLAELHHSYADFINQLNNRIADLMDPFARGHYVDYRFRGSTSIKAVLPVLAPELNYKNLEIGNGGLALVEWHKMIYDQDLSQKQKDQIADNLLEYCKLDTFAMVQIYRYLTDLTQ